MSLIKILFFCFPLTLQLLSCSIFKQSLKPDELLISDDIRLESPQYMTNKQVQYDLKLLIYAFENGYGGRKFIPSIQYKNSIDRLHLISEHPTSDPLVLCKEIDDTLLKITDLHLSARINDKLCGMLDKTRIRKANVGRNVHKDKKFPWSIQHMSIIKNKIPVISLISFPNHEDTIWQGFLETVLKEKQGSNAIIIDLRGNGGGDDTIGRKMASYFYGQDFISPVQSQIKSQTPETLAMLVNYYKLRILQIKKRGELVPKFWNERLADAMIKYTQAKSGKIPNEIEILRRDGKQFDPMKGYTKPIYILIDAECVSSCESTVEAFEKHPYAITVGENTGGFIHFGNLGFIVLPFSKIQIQMATDFWKFKDGRFLEGIGYTPKIIVTPGTDALDVVKQELEKFFQ